MTSTNPPQTRRERRFRRLIDRELTGQLPPSHRADVVEHLRANPDARAHYDQGIEAYRALASDDIANVELEQVEQWLFAGPNPVASGPPEPVRKPIYRAWGLWAALTACAALLLWLGPTPAPQPDGLTPKGTTDEHRLMLEVLCGEGPTSMHTATKGCSHTQSMGFAYRVARPDIGADTPMKLSIFGVDARGRVQYYLPTPVDDTVVAAQPGDSQPVAIGVDLKVNHRPGDLRVFGLLSPVAPNVQQIDRIAETLAPTAPAQPGDPPWHQGLDPDLLSNLCPAPANCASAEVFLELTD